MGRWIQDRITTLPSGVSASIHRIEFEYAAKGRLLYINIYAALTGTTPANKIRYAYIF